MVPPKTRRTAAEIARAHLAIRYFHLGHKLIEIKTKSKSKVSQIEFERQAKKFGLTVAPGYGREIRYKSVELAKAFGPDESTLLELCRKRSDGFQITLSHLLELIRSSDAKTRDKLAGVTFRQRLTSLALRAKVREQKRGWTNKRKGAGRPVAPPRSKAHAVARIEREIAGVTFVLQWLREQPPLQPRLTERLALALDKLKTSLEPHVQSRGPSIRRD